MTLRATALLDVEQLRTMTTPSLFELRLDEPVVVLGSRQDVSVLDEDALHRDGVGVRRRRGGGGAVLLRPDDCWIELWLPAPGDGVTRDVRSTAYDVGERWREALADAGVVAEVHRGGVVRPEQGDAACFAGLGPGELTVDGRKVVGLSQWRARQGALVSSVACSESPMDLLPYLSATAPAAPALRDATSLLAIAPTLTATSLASAFARAVATVHTGVSAPLDLPT